MSLRTLIRGLARRCPAPPDGTTHVLHHLPSFLLESPGPDDADGWWEIQPLASWLAGALLDNQPFILGPADMDGSAFFAEETLGCPVILTPFEVEITDDDGHCSVEPAYYITARW